MRHPEGHCSCCGEGERSATGMTWACDTCEAEYDYRTFGGSCPNGAGCDGELQWERRAEVVPWPE